MVADGDEIPEAAEGQQLEIVTASTPFYAESGGQVGDTGTISGPGFNINFIDTVKRSPPGLILHKGKVISGRIQKGKNVSLRVDGTKRVRPRL